MHTQSVTELLGVVAIIAGLDNHGLSAGEATVQNNDYLAVLETAKLHKQFNTVKLMPCKSITIVNYSHSHFVLLYRFDVCLGEQPLGCVAELVQQDWRGCAHTIYFTVSSRPFNVTKSTVVRTTKWKAREFREVPTQKAVNVRKYSYPERSTKWADLFTETFNMDHKRKVAGTFVAKGTVKLRKIALNAFGGEEEDDTAQDRGPAPAGNKVIASGNTVTYVLELEEKEVISKTAAWVMNNPDKSSVLHEKSRENPSLAFLQDIRGESAAGRFYLSEVQRLKAERDVAAVCADVLPTPPVHVSASQVASFIHMTRLQSEPSPASTHGSASNTNSGGASAYTAHGNAREGRGRRSKWGPPVEQPVAVSCKVQIEAPSTHFSAPSSSSSKGAHRSSGTEPSEADEIAQMAASFDSIPQEDRQRLEKQLQEQREMQLLESRIRDAAAQSLGAGDAGGRNVTEVAKFLAAHASSSTGSNNGDADPYAVNLAARKGPELLIAEKQAALYLERLAQYEELAALDDDYRDTVEECERRGGVIDGGTWEHRKRAKEMLATAGKNLELTLLGAGKHHMADYLPPEVLQGFLRNAEQVTGKAPQQGQPSSAAEQQGRIDESNVGFQLLKKSGWTEGAGLGVRGMGIVNPISAVGGAAVVVTAGAGGRSTHSAGAASGAGSSGMGGASSASGTNVVIAGGRGPDGAGLGVRATHEVGAEDSEFDQYRKRMMLAYRFRPNPLNNPRRNYY
jgi:hypothetical protein